VSDAERTVPSDGEDEIGARRGSEHTIATCAGAGCPNRSIMKATTRKTERFADPASKPDRPVL